MKKIGGVVYAHESSFNELTPSQQHLVRDCGYLFINENKKAWRDSNILKIDTKNNSVTFIESPDWDEAREPIVGDAYKITLGAGELVFTTIHGRVITGSMKLTKKKNNPQIYHHKWMFVSEDYTGFDVEESKRWSELWQSIIPATKEIKSRIGYKDYWEKILNEYGI